MKAALRGIVTRSQKIHQALTIVDAGGGKAAAEAQPDNAALQAAKAVSDIKTPAVEQDERRPSPGRKAVEKFSPRGEH